MRALFISLLLFLAVPRLPSLQVMLRMIKKRLKLLWSLILPVRFITLPIAITSSASASAGSEGASASVNATQSEAGYHKGMAVCTMAKGGLMYQATIGGQKYEYKSSK